MKQKVQAGDHGRLGAGKCVLCFSNQHQAVLYLLELPLCVPEGTPPPPGEPSYIHLPQPLLLCVTPSSPIPVCVTPSAGFITSPLSR